MTISKITGRALIGGTSMLDQTNYDGTGATLVPSGTTSQRPTSPVIGNVRYNTTLDCLEQYTSNGWAGIEPPPVLSSVSGYINEDDDTTITITGSNFKSGCVVGFYNYSTGSFIKNSPTVTFVSGSEITATTGNADVAMTPNTAISIRVINPSSLYGTLENALVVEADPVWTTSAGSIGTIADSSRGSVSLSVAATSSTGTVTYALQSSSLPAGLSLNTSTGAITGSLSAVASDTTYSFTIRATTDAETVSYTDRTFSVTTSAPTFTWATASGTIGTKTDLVSISGLSATTATASSGTVSYTIASGALPSGLSINSSTGAITGTASRIGSSSVTSSFTVRATTTSASAYGDRSYSITLTPYKDGSDAVHYAKSAKAIKDLTATTTDGLYYINVPGQGAVQVYCDMNTDGGGWTLLYKTHHATTHTFVYPSSQTYYAANFNPRSATYATSECNLPSKYSTYCADNSSNISAILVEEYDYGSGNADYIYRYASPTSDWESNSNSTGTIRNLLRYNGGNFTNIVDRCNTANGTAPTSNSADTSSYIIDKQSPDTSDSTSNWDVALPSGNTDSNKKDANCNRYGAAGPGTLRSASLLFWGR